MSEQSPVPPTAVTTTIVAPLTGVMVPIDRVPDPAGPADASPATDALPVDAAFRRLLEGWRRSGPVQPVRENDHAS